LSLEELESKNHLVCRVLTALGFDGRHLKVELPRKPAPKRKEAPTSAANDRKFYVELSEASTAGKTFTLTGGKHISSTDIQIALELKKRKKESEGLAAKKAKATRGSKESELDAKELAELDQKGKQYVTEEGSATLTCPQLDALLRAVLG
jgi:hypothetical protein